MSKKRKRRQEAQEAPQVTQSNTRDTKRMGWIKRALAGLGLVTLVLGIAGWYLREGLTEQKTALQETRQAWVSVRETDQKYIDDRVALNEQLRLFYQRQLRDNADAEWIEARQKELIAATERDDNACNASKDAKYSFEHKLRNLCRSFALQQCPTELAPMVAIEQMCGAASQAAGRLRYVKAVNIAKSPIEIRIGPYSRALAVIAEEDRILEDTRTAEREHNQRVEEFLSPIENQSIWARVWNCIRTTGGSS